ncbi:cytochrome c [Paenibacillus sp. IB182496]|uniref:Cytochrome c n=1 Tax=Paenibacillus sabuli TaxID=2772509 RepID=A0A927BVR4_9BACL|nr:cytochrome c [Paenibacillus sabuli]MBD2847736.1 cytochrome c [Paenibacillus sabuli]
MKGWKYKAAVALTGVVLLAGCGGGGANENNTAPPAGNNNNAGGAENADVAAAETIYKQNCLACHGADLEGRAGPNLQKVGGKYDEQELINLITNGRGGMPAFKDTLDESQIQEVSAWLAAKK